MSATFEKARQFMYRNARPLDLARFRYHFENGDKEEVLKVLSFYQNEDGGCGHAVEADCWNPNSTPLHSSSASDIVRYAEPDSALFHLGIRVVNEAIESLSQHELLDRHTCASYVRMKEYVEKAGVTEQIHYNLLKDRLHESVNNLIDRDTSKWGGYVCRPSQFLSSRDSEYYKDNKDIAGYECTHIINSQLPDGSWDIPWGWDGFPDEWAISRNWWKGQVIIENLLYLKGFQKS